MQSEHFDQSLFLAARLVENSQHDDAIVVLRPLLECELQDFHKMIVCVNLAIIFGQKGQASDALAWYDRGIGYERMHGRFFAAERKAAFMAECGWLAESLSMYEKLLSEPSLTDEDSERIRNNFSILKQRAV
jgi:predicted negative regulator of RcsB-dependent stress response